MSETADPIAGLTTKSLAELEREMARDHARLEAALCGFTAAEGSFARMTGPARFVTNEAHQASFQEHAGILDAPEAQALWVAGLVHARARRLAARTQEERAQPKLTDAALASAAARREFVKEDCESLPLGEVRDAVRLAVAEGDRAALWLYLRYLPRRFGNLRPADRGAEAERQELDSLLKQAAKALTDGKAGVVHEKARKLLARAQEARERAGKRQRAAEAERLRASGRYER